MASILFEQEKIDFVNPIAEVEGNDDLLTIILARLPGRSIYRFMCVSKRWKITISAPIFHQTYYNSRKAHRRMIACIQATDHHITMLPISSDHSIDTSVRSGLRFLSSSNGLILCNNWPAYTKDVLWTPLKYHIINPLTKRSVLLPRNKVIRFPVMTLMCEEDARDLVLRYKVVAAGVDREESALVMETYSSNTNQWTTSKLTVTWGIHERLQPSDNTIVVNGIIHWLTCKRVAVYDSNQAEPSIQMIQLPFGSFHKNLKLARSSRDDPLWLCENYKTCLRTWMLPNNGNGCFAEREWVLMHNISYIYKPFTIGGISYPEWWPNSYEYIVLVGMVPPNAVYLVSISSLWPNSGLIYQCNLESASFDNLVHVRGRDSYFSYMEPLSLSSYALAH